MSKAKADRTELVEVLTSLGGNQKQTAERLGMSRERVRQILRDLNIDAAAIAADAQRSAIENSIANGHRTITSIARDLGWSKQVTNKRLAAFEIEAPDPLINSQIGNWSIKRRVKVEGVPDLYYQCVCTLCDGDFTVAKSNLASGRSKSCLSCAKKAWWQNKKYSM
jgi:transcriptional regulator with XRE-family HTH domain